MSSSNGTTLALALTVASLSALTALSAFTAHATPPAPAAAPAAPAAPARTFLLLVYPIDPAKAAPAYAAKAGSDLVAEYRAWAEGLRDRGLLVDAAKLETDGALVTSAGVTPGAAPASQPPVSGYFLVRAESGGTAADLAASCPHVAYGGTVVVRELATARR